MSNGIFSNFNKGRIVNIKIVALLDGDTNTMEYHGLVRIEPENVALKVIKRLDRKPFKGVRINVRKYCTRSWHNDSRAGLSRVNKTENRRMRDRRRRNVEVIDDHTNSFSSLSSFHRVL